MLSQSSMFLNSISSQNSLSGEIVEKSQNTTKISSLDMSTHFIKPPFPPMIKVSDIISKRDPTQINLKGPNAFLIYRKAFLEHLSNLMHLTSNSSSSLIGNEREPKDYGIKSHLKMTEFSKFVSICWNSEPEFVKEVYKSMAKQVKDELEQLRKNNSSRIGRSKVIWRNAKCPFMKKKKDEDSSTRLLKNTNHLRKENNKEPGNNGKEKGNVNIKKEKSRSKNGNIGHSKTKESANNIVYEFVSISPETIKASQPKEKSKVRTSDDTPWVTESAFTVTPNSNFTSTPTPELINNDYNIAYSEAHSSNNLNYITNEEIDWNLNFLTAQYPVEQIFYDNCMFQNLSQGLPNERIGVDLQDLYLQDYL
ncbi:3943_t:CDS:1 [Cetraspora pellucida]|uniref:3943_t:CDS:1 n=1 Tax=Cetraspora pellucida TaxID=1433469 RepID=A0ACA9L8T4_9GLOM|nr:3943_t:CDS:1 [Cetraspora pellucida]